MHNYPSLGLSDAKQAVSTILAAIAAEGDRPAAVAVVGHDGELVYALRQTGAAARLIGRARAKAYTAAVLGLDTSVFRSDVLHRPGRTLDDWGDPLITSLPGGVVARDEGVVVGAIGCTGNSIERDEALARLGIGALQLRSDTTTRRMP